MHAHPASQDHHQGDSGQQVDPEDLSRLVKEYGPAVYRLALSITRDPALAEDVSQDTLMKAWLALPTLQNPAAAKGWILRIAHNTTISALRTQRAILTDPSELPEANGLPGETTAMRVESRAAVDDFVLALDELDELSRSIVVLRELEELSYEEIADMLEVGLPTVKTRLLRARRRLATSLKEWA